MLEQVAKRNGGISLGGNTLYLYMIYFFLTFILIDLSVGNVLFFKKKIHITEEHFNIFDMQNCTIKLKMDGKKLELLTDGSYVSSVLMIYFSF